MAVIQQVYFAKEGYSIYIRAIKPDEDNPESGLIWISGNPSRLVNNGCMEEKDGELYVVYKEVEFNPNLK